MSGIIGLACFEGPEVDARLLDGLVEGMAFRGPDGAGVWHGGDVALGVAGFAASDRFERQPLPVSDPSDGDEALWIAADARLDGRTGLRADLDAAGTRVPDGAGDSRLLLHAYQAWGLDAFRRLLGDFACIIWDGRARRLIAARDALGIRPLYVASWRHGVAVGNTLETLLTLPGIDRRPDPDSVADYLLFDNLRDPAATPFAAIRQLPPAHLRTWSVRGATATKRYWSFDDLDGLAPPALDDRDWPRAWRARLRSAVADRVPGDGVAVLMSGGLDSTAVASLAHQAVGGAPDRLHLHTAVYDPLIRDQEGHFASLVARDLTAAHRLHRIGEAELFEGWDTLVTSPLLSDAVLEAPTRRIDRALAADARVVLTGHGGDPALPPDVSYFLRQITTLRWLRAWRYLRDAPRRSDRRLPPLGLDSAHKLRRQRSRWDDGFPTWLAPDFERDLGLRDRWRAAGRARHEVEPDRRRHFVRGLGSMWPSLFEHADAGARRLPLEQRHPFFDLRVLALGLSMPAVPWCVEKHVLREAMRGIIPEAVRSRPKSGMPEVPPNPPSRRASDIWLQWERNTPALGNFLNSSKVLEALKADECGPGAASTAYRWENRRPLNLGLWMRGWGESGAAAAIQDAAGGSHEREPASELEENLQTSVPGGLR